MWEYLVEIALLGTEKKTLDTTLLPPEIQEAMSKSFADPEQTFLEAAVLSRYYQEAGKQPERIIGELDETIIEETRIIAPTKFKEVFNLLDNVHYRLKEKFINLWLDSLIRKELIIESDSIIQLLKTGNSLSESTKIKIIQVIGNKGNWLLQFQRDFQYDVVSKNEKIWSEGNSVERKNYFTRLLAKNPEQSIALLKSTWEQESLVNKRGYLELIKKINHPAIIDFARFLYETEFKFNAKEKKTEKECRKIVAEILLSSKDTQLHQTTIKYLNNYFTSEKKKGLLGFVSTKMQTEYLLPEESDADFWNSTNMEQAYGFEVKDYDISLFKNQNQYWLSCFLETVSAEAWLNDHISNYSGFINCFIDSDNFVIKIKGESYSIFLNTIINNACTYSNKQLALSLLSRISTTDAIPLLKHITPEEYEQFVRKNKYFHDAEILENGPYNLEESWSQSFSDYILTSIFELSMQSSNHNLNGLGIAIAQFINTSSNILLQKLNEKAIGSNFYHQWSTNIYEPVNISLQIRKTIETLNS